MSDKASSRAGLLELMHIFEQLKTTKRAGWVRLGSPAPESISDHMYRMAMLAMLSEEDSKLDISKCVMMSLVHDLAEAEVGDITPHDGISREEKHELERLAIEKFTTRLLSAQSTPAQRIRSLWQEYEDGETREAKFVKDLVRIQPRTRKLLIYRSRRIVDEIVIYFPSSQDRFELALQGVEYERRDKLNSIQNFFDTTVPFIKHPEVKAWANELMDERAAIQASDPFVLNYKDVRPSSSDA